MCGHLCHLYVPHYSCKGKIVRKTVISRSLIRCAVGDVICAVVVNQSLITAVHAHGMNSDNVQAV